MKKFIIYVLIPLFTISCTKDSIHQDEMNVLPAITEIGANTAGVIIDGYVLVPKDGQNQGYLGASIIRGLDVTLGSNFITSNGNDNFTLFIKNVPAKNGFILLMNLQTLSQTGNIFTTAGNSLPENNIYVGKVINGSVQQQFYSRENSCKIIITKADFNTGIISGTLAGDVYDINNNKIELTNGRFDIKIK
jgi:hypothetical protein